MQSASATAEQPASNYTLDIPSMKISIITATYNSASTLRDTIESVLAQTYTDIEYIVVDGASTDATSDIIRSYVPLFNGRMTYISEPDKGLYDAMNKGIACATGDVVGLLNSDDFYSSADTLEKIAAAFTSKHVDAVYGDVHYVDQTDLGHTVRHYSSRVFSPGLMRFGFMPAHPSFYCRREIYRQYGVFDTSYKVAADFELLLRLLVVHRISTAYIPCDCVTMRAGGVSNSGFRSHYNIMRDHRRALRTHRIASCYFLLSLRYFYKIAELFTSHFSRPVPLPSYIRERPA